MNEETFLSGKKYYNPKVPKHTKIRFQNLTLYKNCIYENSTFQTCKILEEYYKQSAYRPMLNINENEKKLWLSKLFDLLQETYTMIENNFTNEEIINENKKHLEKMIEKYEPKSNFNK